MIYDLFPTAIGFYNLDRKLSNQELKTILNLKTMGNTSNRVSVDKSILKKKSLDKLNTFFNYSLQDYVNKTIAPIDTCEYYITSSWANYNAEGEFHFSHNHENSLVSAVFYVNAVKGRDCIVFEKNTAQHLTTQLMTPDTKAHNPYNSTTWKYEVETNQLYFFPSHLIHLVPPVDEGEERISVSFNVFACGDIGELSFKKATPCSGLLRGEQ